MNVGDMFSVLPKLLPLMPRIEKALATVQRLEADPEVQDALAVAKDVAEVFIAAGLK